MLQKHITLAALFILALVVAIAHHEAFEHFLYWRFWWFDRLMHFAGGALIAGGICWIFQYELPERYQGYTFFAAVLGAAIIGTLWESFEYTIGYTQYPALISDTRLDMLMNILGALAVCAMMGWWRAERSQ